MLNLSTSRDQWVVNIFDQCIAIIEIVKTKQVKWLNPPHRQNVKTNINKLFIKLVRSKFLKNNKSHKIFSLNLLKISYCCTTNAGNIIKQHNSKVLSKTNDNKIRKCNCRSKPNCPWNGECLNQCLVYKATSATCSNSLCLLWNF